MNPLLSLLITLASPPDARCEAWIKADAPAAAETEHCIRHFLGFAYGKNWKPEDLTLDPGYGNPVERSLSRVELDRMTSHVRAVCSDAANPELPCARAIEFFQGMANRKLSVFDEVNMASYEDVLGRILRGEAIDSGLLFAEDKTARYSKQTLRKLRNAAYARHGYRFKDADLNEFFYGPRAEPVAGLPLPTGDKAEVTLTAVDEANVKVVKALEK